MKRNALIITLLLAVILPVAVYAQCSSCSSAEKQNCAVTQTVAAGTSPASVLAGYNKENWINNAYYFTYNFDKKPKMGTSILKVKLYGKNKKMTNAYQVFASADMPSMRGMHNSGDKQLKPNKKGELLVPIQFVMPGVWEVTLKFVRDGQTAYTGRFELKI